MAIDSEHPEYTARMVQWEKIRDCAAGQEAIHAAGTKYLPKLSEQDTDEYNAYRDRALFYGATARTVDGLSGMVFRKAPQFEVSEGFEPLLDDVTLSGMNLQGFAEAVVDDDIKTGRVGILVDHPIVAAGTSKADAEKNNSRPFLKMYKAEQIFNWKVEGRKNAQVLTQVRLWEFVEYQGDKGEFDIKERKQIRVLDLDPATGKYRQRIFIKVKYPATGLEEWVQSGPDIFPLKNGAPLDVIPFFFVGVKNSDACPEKPPLIDMANINISHYKSSADLEHGAHFTGLPTAVIIGHSEDPENPDVFKIGSTTAWVFPNENAKVEYLEFEGTGLDALEKRLEIKERQMAALGARMLSVEKKGVEATETAQIYRSGESSVLASLSAAASLAIEKALKFMSDWAGFPSDKLTFKLNKDFMGIQMSSDELTALLQTWQAGGIAYADFLACLKRGEIVAEERTEEDIRSEVETENPFLGEDMPPRPTPLKPKPGEDDDPKTRKQ